MVRYFTSGTQAKTLERSLQVADYLIGQSRGAGWLKATAFLNALASRRPGMGTGSGTHVRLPVRAGLHVRDRGRDALPLYAARPEQCVDDRVHSAEDLRRL